MRRRVEVFRITEILPKRLGDTSSAQNPRITRSHPVRFGLRRCERFMISNWCLTASDSAATARTPPGRASRARVTNRWAIRMNSNLIERRAFTASGCFASLRYRTIFCQNYQFATHTMVVMNMIVEGLALAAFHNI
jgi:hypothetical protein